MASFQKLCSNFNYSKSLLYVSLQTHRKWLPFIFENLLFSEEKNHTMRLGYPLDNSSTTKAYVESYLNIVKMLWKILRYKMILR